MSSKKTLIIGASTNPSRYAYLAANKLVRHGYEIVQVGNKTGQVAGVEIHKEALDFENVDTVTLYLGPKNQVDYYQYILSLKPRRVIFNPGTWNPDLIKLLDKNEIESLDACTLVMLSAETY